MVGCSRRSSAAGGVTAPDPLPYQQARAGTQAVVAAASLLTECGLTDFCLSAGGDIEHSR